MKKRIVAIILCAVMLLSFTSCGIRVGGVSAEDVIGNIVNEIVDEFTTVAESENHKINIGMMAFYYQSIEGYLNGNDRSSEFAYHYRHIVDAAERENDYKDDIIHTTTVSDELVMSKTVDYVRDLLMYCEVAWANGITVDSVDQRYVEEWFMRYVEMGIYEIEYRGSRSDSDDSFEDKILRTIADELFDANDVKLAIKYAALAEIGKEEMISEVEASVSSLDIEDRHGRLDHHDEFYHGEFTKNYCVLSCDSPSEIDRAVEVLEKANASSIEDVIRIAEEYELGSVTVRRNSFPNVEPTHYVEMWLYSPERECGDIMIDDNSFEIVFYESDGEEIWCAYVRYLLACERIEEAKFEFSRRYPNSLNFQALDLFEAIMDA